MGAMNERWQEKAAKWLEQKAEVEINSLHCGDNSMTIASTHRYAAMLRALAKEIKDIHKETE